MDILFIIILTKTIIKTYYQLIKYPALYKTTQDKKLMTTIKQSIIDLFELDKMEPEKATEMVDRLAKLVFQAVLVRTLPLLSEEDFDKYEKITESEESGEVLFSFLAEKIPNFSDIIAEEAELLRAELAGEFNEAGLE